MNFTAILFNKPVLVGLHLAFAIVGIDLFLWLAGEVFANSKRRLRLRLVAAGGVIGFILSWIIGGYYYVKYYGPIVKPIIKASGAPWAHAIVMEAKEHVFLFIVPMALTVLFLAFLPSNQLQAQKLKRPTIFLIASIVAISLLLGAMGYIISAAARWG